MNMSLKISTKKDKEGKESFEGTVSIAGLKNTKLTRADGETRFASRGNVSASARNLAKKLNLTLEEEQPKVKKAAKKAVRTPRKAKTADCSSTSCSGPCSPIV